MKLGPSLRQGQNSGNRSQAPRLRHGPKRRYTVSRSEESPIRLDVHQLEFAAGFKTLIEKVSFGVRPGECVAILGPSGAGKSTLLKLLQGVYTHEDAAIRYQGLALSENRETLRRQLGYVPQDDIVHPSLSPGHELSYAARLRLPDLDPKRRDKRIRETLKVLELDHVATTRTSRLSGGQRKRVSIGVELLAKPPVLLLDEPTSGLDPALEQKMMALLSSIAKEGRTVLVTTHVMESLAEVDLVLILMKGHLIFYGPPATALNHFGAASFSRIYSKLESNSPKKWAELYRGTTLYPKYVTDRLQEPVSSEPSNHSEPVASPPEAPPAPENPKVSETNSPKVAKKDLEDLDAEIAALKEEMRS